MSDLRFRVVETAFKKKAIEVPAPEERPSEYFGKYVFNKAKMFKYLPTKVYQSLMDAMDNGTPLNRILLMLLLQECKNGQLKWELHTILTGSIH